MISIFLRHSLWLAPLISFAGFVSYYMVFAKFPVLRDFPWINLPLVTLGTALAIAGLWAGWKESGRIRRCFLGLGTLFSVALAGLLFFYVFVLSYQLPAASKYPAALAAEAQDFTLNDANGNPISLASFRGKKKVVISFYRGFW